MDNGDNVKYEVNTWAIDEFFYRRTKAYPCASKEDAIATAIVLSQKQCTATLYEMDDDGKNMKATLFVHGEVQKN